MITVRVIRYGKLDSEKLFKDTDDVEALEYAESVENDLFDPAEVEIWHRGKMVWSNCKTT